MGGAVEAVRERGQGIHRRLSPAGQAEEAVNVRRLLTLP